MRFPYWVSGWCFGLAAGAVGRSGARAGVVFIQCALGVLILLIAQYHGPQREDKANG